MLAPVSSGGLVHLHGPDAQAYAQAQFAQDVQALGDGQWQWNLWLNAKGRVIALFALLRADAREYYLWLPDHPAQALAEQLARLRFRSKLEIQALPQARVYGALAAPATLGLNAHHARADLERDAQGQLQRIGLDLSGQSGRSLVLDLHGPDRLASLDSDFDAHWRLEDIAHGLPRLADTQTARFTPQMLALERLPAFSTRKGCYPGQEIVARTHFLGQVKRSLIRLSLNRSVEPGTDLGTVAGPNQIELVCCAQTGERIEALAVAPVELDPTQPLHDQTGLIQATALPLLDGLART